MDLEIEANVNTAKFEEAAAEGTAGEPGCSEFREEAAAANEDFAGPAGNHGDFISAGFRPDQEPLHVLHGFELNAFGPTMGRPRIEECACRTADGGIHTYPF